MKARVKATGEIIEVIPYGGFDDYDYYDPETKLPWLKSELSFDVTDSDPDYWTKLEHQYAGMAMQGLLSNQTVIEAITNCKATMERVIPLHAYRFAHALVEKYKKEERK